MGDEIPRPIPQHSRSADAPVGEEMPRPTPNENRSADAPVGEEMPRPTPHENRSAEAPVGDEMPRPTPQVKPSEGQIRSAWPPCATNGRDVPRLTPSFTWPLPLQ